MYAYLISAGSWESIEVHAIALADHKLTTDEIQSWREEVRKANPPPPGPYHIDLVQFLKGKGLKVFYPVGEFNAPDLGDFRSHSWWDQQIGNISPIEYSENNDKHEGNDFLVPLVLG
jgi:hypothetical protein